MLSSIGYKCIAIKYNSNQKYCFGYRVITTGHRNTTGTDALLSNTTGAYNSAFGYDSMGLNTTGANNIALGRNIICKYNRF